MHEVILHHYPASPVSEKVRIAMGIKKLAWRSVEIPRVPPKPDVMPLTGGYRRTPVMQIGADIYCDSQCILRALERHCPQPTLFPGGNEGLAWVIARWTDALFQLAVSISLGANADQLPEAFVKDRAPLFFGPNWEIASIKADVPHAAAQLRTQFAWIDAQLANSPYLLGQQPGMADTEAYYLVWFVRARWQDGPRMLAQFPALEDWEKRIAAIGHGAPAEMTSAQAIEVARTSVSATPAKVDPQDPQSLIQGQRIGVKPDLDSGEPTVLGTLHYLDAHEVALLREDARVGKVCVHFPRVGYRIVSQV